MLVDSRIQSVHLRDIADNAGQIGKVSRNLVVRVITRGKGSWYAEVNRVQVYRKIRSSWAKLADNLSFADNPLRPTLRGPNHCFANEDCLPYSVLHGTVGGGRVAVSSCFVIVVVIIQTQLLAHLDTLDDAHPRAVKVPAFGRSFPRLQNQQQRLQRTQSGDIQKRVRVPYSTLVKHHSFFEYNIDALVAKANHCCPSPGSSTILPASANIASRTKGDTESLSVCH